MKKTILFDFKSAWLLIALFSTVGYAKDPFFGLPLFIIVFIFFYGKFHTLFKNKIYRPQLIILFFTLIYFLTRWLLQQDATTQDFIFIITLMYKIFTGVIIAHVFYSLLFYAPNLIYFYLIIQLTLILASAFNDNLYNFLLLFQTNAARDVFSHTFGLRSMGLGIIHNEGVVFLAIFYIFLTYNNPTNKIGFFFAPLMYISGLASRMGIILIAVLQVFLFPYKFIFSVLIISLSLWFLFDTSTGPLSEVFEIYNNYTNHGEISSKSTTALSEMELMPDNISSWLIGDGRFFSSDGFYKETDIGFSRVVFFGGIFGLFFYFLVNLWPLFFIDFRNKSKEFYLLLLGLLICFVLSNLKGINIQNWAFIVFLLISKNNSLKNLHN